MPDRFFLLPYTFLNKSLWQSFILLDINPLKLQNMAVLKVIEVLASSPVSWEDAAASAVKTAGKTVKEIRSVYVKEQSAVVVKNKITEYRVNLKVTFEVI
jgi:flavin-binding protein dodecin